MFSYLQGRVACGLGQARDHLDSEQSQALRVRGGSVRGFGIATVRKPERFLMPTTINPNTLGRSSRLTWPLWQNWRRDPGPHSVLKERQPASGRRNYWEARQVPHFARVGHPAV